MAESSENEQVKLTDFIHDNQSYDAVSGEEQEIASFQGHSMNHDITTSLRAIALQMIHIFIPVSFCMLFTIYVVETIPYYQRHDVRSIYTPYVEDNLDAATRFWHSLVNALIVLAVVIVMTTVLVLLYKCHCYKIILGWMILVSFLVLFVFSGQFLLVICYTDGVFSDYITFCLVLWNFGIIGLIAIYWKAPLLIQQFYLIAIASLMAILFIKTLPEWTTWLLLVLLALWDLIAVLCPIGPLRILVETSQERDDNFLRSFVYSTSSSLIFMTHSPTDVHDSVKKQQTPSSTNSSHDDQQSTTGDKASATRRQNFNRIIEAINAREGEGMKLGLGDFVFYSVLVGKAASSSDFVMILSSAMAIIIGLECTLIILIIRGHALPALPISICLALIFYFGSEFVISPFLAIATGRQIYI